MKLLVKRLFGLQAEIVSNQHAHDEDHNAADSPAADQFFLAGLRADELGIQVHRSERRSAVEDR